MASHRRRMQTQQEINETVPMGYGVPLRATTTGLIDHAS